MGGIAQFVRYFVIALACAQTAYWLYTFRLIANPMGDGMEFVAIVPFGFIFLAMALSLPEKRAEQNAPFDFFGLATFSLGMIGLQMLLDRSERLEWFDSTEIWAEAIASVAPKVIRTSSGSSP